MSQRERDRRRGLPQPGHNLATTLIQSQVGIILRPGGELAEPPEIITDMPDMMTITPISCVHALALAWRWGWMADHWAALAIGFTLLSLAVFMVLLLAKYVRICLNIFMDTPPPLAMGPMDFKPIDGRIVRFRSFDGTSLRGMHIDAPAGEPAKGTIIFCHEFGSNMYSWARYAAPLVHAGFNVFAFDYRGHGDSSAAGTYRPLQWPSNKELEDTLGACAYVGSRLAAEGKPPDIGIFGISRGAGAAVLAAASDANIKAVVCDSVFSTGTTIMALMKRWAYIFARVKLVYENHPDAFWRFMTWIVIRLAQPKLSRKFPSVRRALNNMQPRAVMFIHGRRDSYIREDQACLLHGEAPSPKYLWIVDRAKHNQSAIVEPSQYAARTIAFFRKYLAGEAVDEAQIAAPDDDATTSAQPTPDATNTAQPTRR